MTQLLLCRTFPPMVGGVERYVSELFRRSRLPVHAVAPALADAARVDASLPFAVSRYPYRESWQFGKRPLLPLALRAMSLAVHDRPTLIFSDQVQSGAVGLPMARMLGVAHVTFAYGLELNPARAGTLKRVVFGKSDRVVAISGFTRGRLLETYRIPPDRICIVRPGVDLDRFQPNARLRAETRTGLGVASEDVVLLTVGRLDASQQYKGYDRVIRVFARVASSRPFLRLLIAGDGSDRTRLQALAIDTGVHDRINFLGALSDDDLRAVYSAADMFVLPSGSTEPGTLDVEGYGIVFAEAAASGLPSIGYRLGGTVDAVADGVSGLLTSPDEDSLEAAVVTLADDRALRLRMQQSAREHAVRSLGWDTSLATFRATVAALDPTVSASAAPVLH